MSFIQRTVEEFQELKYSQVKVFTKFVMQRSAVDSIDHLEVGKNVSGEKPRTIYLMPHQRRPHSLEHIP